VWATGEKEGRSQTRKREGKKRTEREERRAERGAIVGEVRSKGGDATEREDREEKKLERIRCLRRRCFLASSSSPHRRLG
jgi:hypothetical protein